MQLVSEMRWREPVLGVEDAGDVEEDESYVGRRGPSQRDTAWVMTDEVDDPCPLDCPCPRRVRVSLLSCRRLIDSRVEIDA